MMVLLASCGNPDYRQNPLEELYGSEPNHVKLVSSLKEASEECMRFIKDNDLGSGNWMGGEVVDDSGHVVARVSYNGRVWDKEGNEVKIK